MTIKLSAFTLIRNEAKWIGFHLISLKDVVHDFTFFDGNSTDGTIEVIEYVKSKYGLNIKIFKDKDPKDLKDDYVRMFNECLSWCEGDYAFFVHPDMICVGSPRMDKMKVGPMAYSVDMDSFGGESGRFPLRFSSGRTDKWKSIMRIGFGLRYAGHYGTSQEDLYFSDLTGKEYHVYKNFSQYPYEVVPSGIHLYHYSDVRPYSRRLNRMVTCICNENPSIPRERAYEMAKNHPRVTLEPGNGIFGNFEMGPAPHIPEVFRKHGQELADVLGQKLEDFLPFALQSPRSQTTNA